MLNRIDNMSGIIHTMQPVKYATKGQKNIPTKKKTTVRNIIPILINEFFIQLQILPFLRLKMAVNKYHVN